MDKTNFDNQRNALIKNAHNYKKLLSIMILANIVLSIALVFNTNREKIILVPQVSPEYRMWIDQSHLSFEYLNTLSRNMLDLLLNITPNNVTAQHHELLKTVTPKYRAELHSKLNEIAHQVIQNGLSQNFYIETIHVINGKNIVYVKGTLNQYIDKNTSSSITQIYKLEFGAQGYFVQLNNIELVPDNDSQLKDFAG